MIDNRKKRIFVPVMLAGLLAFSSVSAEAKSRREDRATKGALIGATLGTLAQIATGHTEGRDVLGGAVVGGLLGAAAGASSGHDRYHRGYAYRDGYPVEVYGSGYVYDGYRDGRYDGRYYGGSYDSGRGYYSGRGYDSRDRRYDRYDSRRGERGRHRHDADCDHR